MPNWYLDGFLCVRWLTIIFNKSVRYTSHLSIHRDKTLCVCVRTCHVFFLFFSHQLLALPVFQSGTGNASLSIFIAKCYWMTLEYKGYKTNRVLEGFGQMIISWKWPVSPQFCCYSAPQIILLFRRSGGGWGGRWSSHVIKSKVL